LFLLFFTCQAGGIPGFCPRTINRVHDAQTASRCNKGTKAASPVLTQGGEKRYDCVLSEYHWIIDGPAWPLGVFILVANYESCPAKSWTRLSRTHGGAALFLMRKNEKEINCWLGVQP